MRDENSYHIVYELTGVNPQIHLDPVLIYGFQKEIEGLEKEVAELEESFSTMDSRDYEKLLKAQSDYEEKNNLLNEKIERFLELDERA